MKNASNKTTKTYKPKGLTASQLKQLKKEPKFGTPDIDTPKRSQEWFEKAMKLRDRRLNPPAKKRITAYVDQDVLAFFKAFGTGYQTRINEVLVQYMIDELVEHAAPDFIKQLHHAQQLLGELEESYKHEVK